MKIEILGARIIPTAAPCIFTIAVIEEYAVELEKLRRSKKLYCSVTISTNKPRTTGPYSQSNHLHGHIRQLAYETGNDFESVKTALKMFAVENLNYPCDYIFGVAVPKPEHDADTEMESILIEAAHLMAAEFEPPITLREEN